MRKKTVSTGKKGSRDLVPPPLDVLHVVWLFFTADEKADRIFKRMFIQKTQVSKDLVVVIRNHHG